MQKQVKKFDVKSLNRWKNPPNFICDGCNELQTYGHNRFYFYCDFCGVCYCHKCERKFSDEWIHNAVNNVQMCQDCSIAK